MFVHTTPGVITDQIREFCRTISCEEPYFVPVQTTPGAEPRACYTNVLSMIDLHGGEVVRGWIVWETPGYLLEAEPHHIWKADQMNPICITPKEDGETVILFLPDPTITWPGPYVACRRQYLVNTPQTRAYMQEKGKRDRLRAAAWDGRQYVFPREKAAVYDEFH